MKNGTAVLIIFLALVVFLVAGFSVKVPYTANVVYEEEEPYVVNENYWDTEYRSNKNCDSDSRCECLHYGGLFNLGSCDSCRCNVLKTKQITQYKTVKKEKSETKYQNLFESWGLGQ